MGIAVFNSGSVPWKWINVYNDKTPGGTFLPVEKNICHPGVYIDLDDSFLETCSCIGKCKPETCECRNDVSLCTTQYDRHGRIRLLPKEMVIVECNRKCKCSDNCTNRTLQKGPVKKSLKLQLFFFPGKGWGVQTIAYIPSKTFCCEYVGEVISEELAEYRGQLYDKEGLSYLWTQTYSGFRHLDAEKPDSIDESDEKDLDAFTIDATAYGHMSRFINHSCDPNLFAVIVYTESRDPRDCRVGFYSKKEILPNSELTIDYHYDKDKWEGLGGCRCGSSNCIAPPLDTTEYH